jgi:hypothetical protein
MRHELSHLSILFLGSLVLAAVPVAAAAAPAADSVQGALNAVACTSPASCISVGSYVSAAGQVSLAEGWDGSAWTVQPTPNPAGAFSTALDGVACGSPGACLAVGHYTYGSEGQDLGVLAELWNGASWTIQAVPLPAGALAGSLVGVSCASASACTAVGYYANSANSNVALAESWNGTSFTSKTVHLPAGTTTSILDAVSCSAAPSADCEAVGWDFRSGAEIARTLETGWNGTSWSVQGAPQTRDSQGGSYPGGMSCSSADSCTSVGEGINSGGSLGDGWAQAWDGSKWSNQATHLPKGGIGSILDADSCSLAPATACTAVGYYTNGSAFVDYAEAWNGTKWLVQKTPEPSGATAASLAGVSCSSPPGTCVAVGSYTTSAGVPVTLAEGWNGTKWSVQATPTP